MILDVSQIAKNADVRQVVRAVCKKRMTSPSSY